MSSADSPGARAPTRRAVAKQQTRNRVLAAARNLFLKQNLAGGESNIYFQDVQIIEADRLP